MNSTNEAPNTRSADSPPGSYGNLVRQLVWCGLLAISGCIGPWTQRDMVALPSSHSMPTPLDSPRVKKPLTTEVSSAEISPIRDTLRPETKNSKSATEDVDLNDALPIIRGQSPGTMESFTELPRRSAMPVSAAEKSRFDSQVRPAQYEDLPAPGSYPPRYSSPPPSTQSPYGAVQSSPGSAEGALSYGAPAYAPYDDGAMPDGYTQVSPSQYDDNSYGQGPYSPGVVSPLPGDYADLVVNLRETQTGRFMFGVGVNSDLGMTAQVIIDERNFDWRRWPRSLDDVFNGTAWRGGGQTLRIEAVPGSQVQRYLVNFVQPYLWDTPISFNVSGYLFDRRYFDWDEQRLGGRIGFGYRITPDLSLSLGLRAETVDLRNPRVRGIQEIEEALGTSDLYSGKATLTHDTRDIPFAPTQGHYLELSYEQVFGSFDYPRGNLDFRRFFLLRERADTSGRHTLGFSFRGGLTGSQTPVYENFFAGGYSTLRGFRFRHASPKIGDVTVGGELSLLGSTEYIFPITADDMLKGAIFSDFGTVEQELNVDMDNFRVAVGAGLRISVPAMGPAPIAVDFAIPVMRADSDRIQNISFFVGVNY